jgi:hypothetical protein
LCEALKYIVKINPQSVEDFITYFEWCTNNDDEWSCASTEFSFSKDSTAALFKLVYGN